MQFSQFIGLAIKYQVFLSIFLPNIINLSSSVILSVHVSEPYKTIGRNYVMYILIFTFLDMVLDFRNNSNHLFDRCILDDTTVLKSLSRVIIDPRYLYYDNTLESMSFQLNVLFQFFCITPFLLYDFFYFSLCGSLGPQHSTYY